MTSLREAFTHLKPALRVVLPSASEISAPHQEIFYQPSTTRAAAMWAPLHDVAAGVLEFVPGSHRRGAIDPADVAWVTKRSPWRSAALRAGDVFLFGALTLHRGPANPSRRFRCSIDFRAQPMSEPVLESLLGDLVLPYGLTWEEVYARMPAAFDRKYFWVDSDPVLATDPASRAVSARAVAASRLDRFWYGDLTQLEHVKRIRRSGVNARQRADARQLLAEHAAKVDANAKAETNAKVTDAKATKAKTKTTDKTRTTAEAKTKAKAKVATTMARTKTKARAEARTKSKATRQA